MTIELFLALLALGFASFRITRFIVWSSLIGTACDGQPIGNGFNHPDTSVGVAISEFAYKPNGQYQGWFRGKLGDLLQCTWCAGFWVSAAVYGAWFQPTTIDARAIVSVFGIAAVQSLLNARHETIPVEVA